MYDCQEDKEQHPLDLDEIHTHWKRLWFEYEGDPKDRKTNISLLLERDLLQVFFFFKNGVWLNLCFLHFVLVLVHFSLYNLKCLFLRPM